MTEIDEEVLEVMENNNLDKEAAERVVEVIDEFDITEDEAVELEEEGV